MTLKKGYFRKKNVNLIIINSTCHEKTSIFNAIAAI